MKVTNKISLGRLAGMDLSAKPSALAGSLLLWLVLSAVGVMLLKLQLPEAILMGLAGVILHWVAVLLHQLGHGFAARQTGYAMVGISLWWVLSSSLYPSNEPALPKSVHAQRALGGPIASVLLGVLFALALLFIEAGSPAWWLALFFCVENLLVFGLGAFLPLSFTDGSTLLSLYRDK